MPPAAHVTPEEAGALAALAGLPIEAADLPALARRLEEHRAAQERLEALLEQAGGADAAPAGEFDPAWE
jgi:hypothetical protein